MRRRTPHPAHEKVTEHPETPIRPASRPRCSSSDAVKGMVSKTSKAIPPVHGPAQIPQEIDPRPFSRLLGVLASWVVFSFFHPFTMTYSTCSLIAASTRVRAGGRSRAPGRAGRFVLRGWRTGFPHDEEVKSACRPQGCASSWKNESASCSSLLYMACWGIRA